MFETTQENAARQARVTAYLETLQDGEEVPWIRFEADLNITMDDAGRNIVRDALRKAKRPYESIRGEGIRLSSPERAMAILGQRFVRIDNTVRSADRTQRALQARHLESMKPSEQQKMLAAAGFFGTIRAFAADARKKLTG